MHAVCDGWGASVVPHLLVAERIARGELVDLCSGKTLSVPLYWHCWNLHSAVIDRLTQALQQAAGAALIQG